MAKFAAERHFPTTETKSPSRSFRLPIQCRIFTKRSFGENEEERVAQDPNSRTAYEIHVGERRMRVDEYAKNRGKISYLLGEKTEKLGGLAQTQQNGEPEDQLADHLNNPPIF